MLRPPASPPLGVRTEVTCVEGCTCSAVRLEGHILEQGSQTFLVVLEVTASKDCKMKVCTRAKRGRHWPQCWRRPWDAWVLCYGLHASAHPLPPPGAGDGPG